MAATALPRGAAQEVPGLLRVPGLAESLRQQAAPPGDTDAVEETVAAVREALGGGDERVPQPPSWRDAVHRQVVPRRPPPEQAETKGFQALAQDEAALEGG
ncbi:unnamed protein product [Prorocentrum cordatum]|uniref:Uncharacterized protein n=1 Tax=Prorocentrum cordatum TaxID=2364126 RepID=A0ABN9Y0M7_9DINO|nr:unnamed protein product [Polarella glacialis]